jgi:hypothetical protein
MQNIQVQDIQYLFPNKEARNEDHDTRVIARYGFDRLCSGGYARADSYPCANRTTSPCDHAGA